MTVKPVKSRTQGKSRKSRKSRKSVKSRKKRGGGFGNLLKKKRDGDMDEKGNKYCILAKKYIKPNGMNW